ncbi:MAG: purine-nucleoside phosphorylase [Clostridiaceae bacterium]|nr:purine-nucleoside phosphorylase [Clostridiaceae bacterium]
MDFQKYIDKIDLASESIRMRLNQFPKVAIILGSGLSDIIDNSDVIASIPYADIPGFPLTTVKGHPGKLVVVSISGICVYVMQGRFHYYEGYDEYEVTFPIRVLAGLGVKSLLLTNSAGGIDTDMTPGMLMLITDHLSFHCPSPLRGPNLERYGTRFPDQTFIYTVDYIEKLKSIADRFEIPYKTGVYAYMRGPQYETPAEIRALRMMGASAVGMSTVPEAIVASHCGLKVAAISCISNMASGMSGQALTHQEVVETAASVAQNTIKLIEAFVSEMNTSFSLGE